MLGPLSPTASSPELGETRPVIRSNHQIKVAYVYLRDRILEAVGVAHLAS